MNSITSVISSNVDHYPQLSEQELIRFAELRDYIETDVHIIDPTGGITISNHGSGVYPGTDPYECCEILKRVLYDSPAPVTIVHSMKKHIYTQSTLLQKTAKILALLDPSLHCDEIAFLFEYSITYIPLKGDLISKIDQIYTEILMIYPLSTDSKPIRCIIA